MAGGWGGAREGAGRKPEGYEAPQARLDFEAERALYEKVKREEREFRLARERGEYLPRTMQRQATATALAVLTQSLRSIPDNLERVCNLTPEQAAATYNSIAQGAQAQGAQQGSNVTQDMGPRTNITGGAG